MAPLLGGLLGGALFLVFLLFFNTSIPIALFACGGGFVAGILMAPRRSLAISVEGVDHEALKEAIATAGRKVVRLGELAKGIERVEVRTKAQQLAKTAEGIIADLQDEPTEVKRARQFLNYYLDATVQILQQYQEISSKGIKTPAITEALYKVESLLDSVVDAFEKQRAHLLTDDMFSLDTEIKLLESTLKTESFNR